MKEKLWNFIKSPKNWIIIALIVLLGLVGLFGGRAVTKYQNDINLLKYDKNRLELQISDREQKIKVEQSLKDQALLKIDSCMKEFKVKDAKIKRLESNLDDALSQLEGITSDSSYIFLTTVAYNYKGILKYLFNELQVKAIHGDYLRVQSAEIVIPELKEQVNNCRVQFMERDSLVKHQGNIITLQDKNLQDCKQINQDNDKIIKDQDKTINKERRRKNMWRVVAACEPAAIVVLAIIVGIL